MSELSPVFSTGRGGAGNIVHVKKKQQQSHSAADEVVLPISSPSNDSKHVPSSSFKHDKQGNIHITSGRGGAGNITTSKELPSPKLSAQQAGKMPELSPVFSTGRGGAGNIAHKTTSGSDNHSTIEEGQHKNITNELESQISPVHSKPHSIGGGNAINSGNGTEQKKSGFLKKIKKIFE